jgi:aspartate carbamoyltransferase catalytic subunit
MSFFNRDLTDMHCFTTDELFYILNKAVTMKEAILRRDIKAYRLAADKDLIAALLFYEDSTRTRTSFEIAAMRLGMRTTGFTGTSGTSVNKGESLKHTLDMYEAFNCDALIMRHPLDGSARLAAEHLEIPVFNAGDGTHDHPTQTLLDLFTIREHLGRLDDFDMGIAGDLKYGRTVHSLVTALSKFPSVRIHLFSHADLALPSALAQMLIDAGMTIIKHESFEEMAPEVDIIYQTRIQKERMPDLSEYERAKTMSEFTMKILDLTRDDFGLMHPLPIDKSAPSISSDIDRHPKALYKKQAGNGVPTRLTELALSLGLLGDDFEGETWAPPEEDDKFINELDVSPRSEKRTDVLIRPIQKSGIAIDHLEPYQEELLVRLLRIRERGDVYRAGTVKSMSRPGTVKGILMIEDRELKEEELRVIGAVSPGSRVNIIHDGHVARKLELMLPARISGIPQITCPNKRCITRKEYEESVAPIMVRAGVDRVRCHYCDQVMHSAKMF